MTYDECIEQNGTWNTEYCKEVSVAEAPSSGNPLDFINDFFAGIFSNFGLLVVLVILIILLVMSAKVIQQQEVGIVERLGRYNRSIGAGFHLVIPFFEKIVHRVDLEQFSINVKSTVKTADDQMVILPVVVLLRVIPGEASTSVYEVMEPEDAIKALVSNEVKAKAATITLDDIFTDRDTIKDAVLSANGETITSYGFEVLQVVIDNPELPEELQIAYNSVAVAKKAQQAATANGEAIRIERVAKAQADGEALAITGDAYVLNRDKIAKGNAAAIKEMVGETGLTAVQALDLLKTIDTNNAVRDAAGNKGTTVVVATGNHSDATLGMVASKA